MSSLHPSYESLLAADIFPHASPDLLRLRWNLNSDDISDSILILDDPTNGDSDGEPFSSTHRICELASHCPAVSSIVVSIESLNNYANEWIYTHKVHGYPVDFDEEEWGPPILDSEGVAIRCCGEDRPAQGPKLEIVAEAGHFVTVGQFVDAVHPWLRGLKGQFNSAANVWCTWGPQEDPGMIVRLSWIPIRVHDTKGWTPGWAARDREIQAKIAKNTFQTMGELGL